MFKLFQNKKELEIYSPITGKVLSITDTPDETFADKLIGNGVAIEPEEGLVVSPINGTIATIFRTNHAIGLETEDGTALLIHIGINTVELNGEGFERVASEGDKVKVGDPIMKFDIDFIKSKGLSTITPVVITDEIPDSAIKANVGNQVSAGKEIAFTYSGN